MFNIHKKVDFEIIVIFTTYRIWVSETQNNVRLKPIVTFIPSKLDILQLLVPT